MLDIPPQSLDNSEHSAQPYPQPFSPSSLNNAVPFLHTLATISSPILHTSSPSKVKLTSETSLECPPLNTTAPLVQFDGLDEVSRTTASLLPIARSSFLTAILIQNVSHRNLGWEKV